MGTPTLKRVNGTIILKNSLVPPCSILLTPKMSEIEEILKDQNDKLRDELAELKVKEMQEDLK